MSNPGAKHGTQAWDARTKRLFRFVLAVATVVYFSRCMPAPFLPLVLANQFNLSPAMIGVAMALYPIGSILAIQQATLVAINSRRIFHLHCVSLLALAVPTLLFGATTGTPVSFDRHVALVLLLSLRTLQGACDSVYFAANTSLVTRYFPDDVPYVVGMVEVVVGIGAQTGRLAGGALCEWGGVLCPFALASAALITGGIFGLSSCCSFATECDSDACAVPVADAQPCNAEKLGWDCFTPRAVLGFCAVLAGFLTNGFYDTALPQHLEDYLGPIQMSAIGLVVSSRSIAYMMMSYVTAQLMHHRRASFETLIAVGCVFTCLGLTLVGPMRFAEHGVKRLAMLSGSNEHSVAWCVQIFAMSLTAAGGALTFVPALPLMQSAVLHLGESATEGVSSWLVLAMSGGETLGPVLGGWLVSFVGFKVASSVFAMALLPLLCSAMLLRRPVTAAEQILESERDMSSTLAAALLHEDHGKDHTLGD